MVHEAGRWRRRRLASPPMQMLFGHLADYATHDDRQKLILVGIFDMVMVPEGNPVMITAGTLVAKFRASVLEGTEHSIEARITDADGTDVHPRQTISFQMTPEIGGLGLTINVVVPLAGMSFPNLGEYAFRFYEGDTQVGEVPIQFVRPSSPSSPTTG